MDAIQGGQSFTVTRDGHPIGQFVPLRRHVAQGEPSRKRAWAGFVRFIASGPRSRVSPRPSTRPGEA